MRRQGDGCERVQARDTADLAPGPADPHAPHWPLVPQSPRPTASHLSPPKPVGQGSHRAGERGTWSPGEGRGLRVSANLLHPKV